MKRKIEYPLWVEKYRSKGITIRKVKDGYGLYRCTSRYDKEKGYPRSIQEYLGMVYEDKGFVPKKKELPVYEEYGLSHFIMTNYKRELLRSSYDYNETLVKLSIIYYALLSIDDESLKRSYLARDIDEAKAKDTNIKRVKKLALKIDELLTYDFKEDKERLKRSLLLCVKEKDQNIDTIFYDKWTKDLIESKGKRL